MVRNGGMRERWWGRREDSGMMEGRWWEEGGKMMGRGREDGERG